MGWENLVGVEGGSRWSTLAVPLASVGHPRGVAAAGEVGREWVSLRSSEQEERSR